MEAVQIMKVMCVCSWYCLFDIACANIANVFVHAWNPLLCLIEGEVAAVWMERKADGKLILFYLIDTDIAGFMFDVSS